MLEENDQLESVREERMEEVMRERRHEVWEKVNVLEGRIVEIISGVDKYSSLI